MSFKDFSSAHNSPSKDGAVADSKSAPASDKPDTKPDKAPEKGAQACRS